jgi:hypothetical protein
MEIGIVLEFDKRTRVGVLTTSDQVRHLFTYEDGQSMLLEPNGPFPRFSGRHQQPEPFHLKTPRVGDSLVFTKGPTGVETWGYAEHFVDLTKRRYGSQFTASPVLVSPK